MMLDQFAIVLIGLTIGGALMAVYRWWNGTDRLEPRGEDTVRRWRCQFDPGQNAPYPFPCQNTPCGGAACWVALGYTVEPNSEGQDRAIR